MNSNVIFFINYLLYTFDNVVMVITNTYLLTPKYSRRKTVLIWVGVEIIGGTIKFFMPLHSDADIMLGWINSLTWIILSYVLCKENIFGCLLSYGCVTTIMNLQMLLWQLTPYISATNWEIGTTIGYIISSPMMFIGFAVLLWGKRYLKERRLNMINTKMSVLVLVVDAYYIMYAYLPIRILGDFGVKYNIVLIVEELIAGGLFLIILYMIFKKGEEQQQLERSKELELIRQKEQENYSMLIARTEIMEKIRHDFYGQLTVARHIVGQDRKKGIEMMKELKAQLGSEAG